jgi:membrane-bound lytic murein transglycosylase B
MALFWWASPGLAGPDPIFNKLSNHLKTQGFQSKDVARWMGDPRLRFEARLMASMLSIKESRLNYAQFLTKKNLARAQRFKKKYKYTLLKAQKRYSVSKNVIVAIILVETNLGSYQGRHLVFNTLASQACLDHSLARRRLRPYWPKRYRKDLYSGKNTVRFKKRAAWARQELAALIHIAKNMSKSPFSFKGSPAGAMGMGQFVPTSLLRHGADGNGDRKVELHKAQDAILSVARYLKDHGWRPGLSPNKKIEVILTYNKSMPYAKTVLKIAKRLR